MKIKQYDVFDVYKDGRETFRAIALSGELKTGTVLCVKVDDLAFETQECEYVKAELEVESVLFNLMD